MEYLNIPVSTFEPYFKMTLPQYKVLSRTEQGVITTLVVQYPDRFRSKAMVNFVRKQSGIVVPKKKKPKKAKPKKKKKQKDEKDMGDNTRVINTNDFIILDE